MLETSSHKTGTTKPREGAAPFPSARRHALLAWRILYVRLRFLLVLILAFVVVGNWDALRNHWDKITRRLAGTHPVDQGISSDTEYWCPMCPGVISDWPAKCPVCNMALVRRQRGEAVPLPDGVLARMQFSPYRLQLAGIQTVPIGYQPLTYEIESAGWVEETTAGNLSALGAQAEVLEKDLPYLTEGQTVELTCAAFPGRAPFEGKVRKVLSPSSATARLFRVKVHIDNPRQELRAGMLVKVRIKVPPKRLEWLVRPLWDEWKNRTALTQVARGLAGPPGHLGVISIEPMALLAGQLALLQQGQVLAVPESAVVDTGAKRVVYMESFPGMFDALEVVLGPRCGAYFPILRGLEGGQRVATAGAFLIDAETRLNPSAAVAYFGAARGTNSDSPPRPSVKSAPGTGDPEIAQALAKLPPEDRALAVKQKVCPVTGELLGSMGKPFRVDLEGKRVFLCCQGCESEFRDNWKKYLPLLKAK